MGPGWFRVGGVGEACVPIVALSWVNPSPHGVFVGLCVGMGKKERVSWTRGDAFLPLVPGFCWVGVESHPPPWGEAFFLYVF